MEAFLRMSLCFGNGRDFPGKLAGVLGFFIVHKNRLIA